MKYYISHVLKIPTSLEGKPPDHFNDFHKLKLLTSFDVNLTSSQEAVSNKLKDEHIIRYSSMKRIQVDIKICQEL